jgi:anti-sigma B factor antagonist/stage II sporulation protein AA (anti-sigma F factor antagonist)
VRGRLAELDVETDEGVLVARISGEIDSSNAGELRLALLDGLSNTVRGMVLDLTDASYVDSTGIALVFELARGLEARRQGLRLAVSPEGPVRRVLELSSVESVAGVDDDAASSVAALRAG